MTTQTEITSLNSLDLDYFSYINESGLIPEEFQGKIGVYAIFNQIKELQFVGYSRDIYLGLKQHLIRQPENCCWFKVQTITRPSRTILEEIRQKWIEENGIIPPGNSADEAKWNQPIDAKISMTAEEKTAYQATDELGKIKLLKKVARQVEAAIQEQLKNRGVKLDIRFNPKLKEEGLLDIK